MHIRRIARGVPENKWPLLLEEVSRVLKPEGAIEVIEEDLIFPGGQESCTCHHPPDKLEAPYHPASNDDEPETSHDYLISQDDNRHSPPETPETSTPILTPADNMYQYPSQYYSSQLLNLRDHSRLEQAYNDMHSAKFINLRPISVLTSILANYFKDVRSHPPLLITFPPPEEEMWSESGEESGTSSNEGTKAEGSKVKAGAKSRPSTAGSAARSMDSSAVSSSAHGSPAQSQQTLSPTLSPTSATTMTTTTTRSMNTGHNLFWLSSGAGSAENASGTYMTHPPAGGWHTLHLDVRSLVRPKQPFVMIDRCRMPARSIGSKATSYLSRLPNTTFDLDLQSLTLHLSQSVTEVLECREAIWEYLVEEKRARVKRMANVGATASNMVDRDEFDHWIAKYEREMHERIGMASALRKRLNWAAKGLSGSDNRCRGVGGQKSTVASRSGNPGSSRRSTVAPPGARAPNHSVSELRVAEGGRGGEPRAKEEQPYSSSSSSLPVMNDTATGSSGSTTTRQRTGSAPERVSTSSQQSRGHGHGHGHGHGEGERGAEERHSRAHSLDAVNAFEALFNGPTVGIERETGGRQEQADEEAEGQLPRLSRCVRVFVAFA